ncbi:MAG: hypothetical protein A3K19_22545 [Lentisphaerae bacterium RIFOXYB12_FULL_65_16]|nr:MAG: hypothetical protein A3K18_17520 [Lentisphaerae bacterium RIFOXYA12_64_32]OGV92901.1 MAG: hypothetical protein A3K19_22545 [Lentisphaerae bacterium RIFOXYB12_FULL_65_16]
MLPPPPDPVARARGFVARLSRPGDADLRESVRAAIRTGAAGDHQTRLRAVQALPPASELAPEELQALYWFLASNEPELHGSTSENAIKNDILTHLIKGGSPVPADLLDLLLGVFYDTTQDRTWRDYIVQHFRFYVQQRWPDVRAASLPGDADLTALSDAYGAATRETGTGLAGTALIGLEFLSREYPAFERAKILETAEALARSADAKETVRATALQVCSLARIPAVLPLALDIVRGTGAGVPLRMAAVAMVGDLGGTGDVPILESLLAQGDTRLHTAAATAIDRIRRREAL